MNRVMNVNFMGTLFCMQAEIEAMRRQEPKPNPWNAKRQPERGSIVNIMSVASWVVGPSAAQYAASKHALHAITKGAGIYFILPLFSFPINEL
jgi:NAD(P)-dependent dehydrogenase (short-subunit alcohol dehydrogenase family)